MKILLMIAIGGAIGAVARQQSSGFLFLGLLAMRGFLS